MKPLFSLSLFLLPLNLGFLLGSATRAQAQAYPPEIVSNLVDSCVAGMKQKYPKLAAGQSKAFCGCTFSQFQTKISYADFIDLNNALQVNKPLDERQTKNSEILNDTVQACAKQQGLGNSK